jgi:hypothetical protein
LEVFIAAEAGKVKVAARVGSMDRPQSDCATQ